MDDEFTSEDMVYEEENEKHQEDEAPEGGWGWLVAFGLALVLIVTLGPMACFGLIFGNFLEDLGEGTRGVTLINSVYMTLHSFSGLFTNYVLKSYSCRQVALFGSFLFFLGNFLTSFATNVYHMIITFGILPGIGLGLMIPASFHCFNAYFIRRRVFVMGIAQTILSAGIMLYPIIVEKLVDKFGFRGAQAIVAAMTLNATLGALTFLPVQKKSTIKTMFDNMSKTSHRNGISSSHEVIKSADGMNKTLIRDTKLGSKESISRLSRISSEDVSVLKHDLDKHLTSTDTWQRESVKLIHTLETTYEEDLTSKNSDDGNTVEDGDKQEKERKINDTLHPGDKEEQSSLLLSEDGGKENPNQLTVMKNRSRAMSLASDSGAVESGAPSLLPYTGRRHRAPRPSVISIGSLVSAGAGSIAVQDEGVPTIRKRRDSGSRSCLSAVVDFLDLSLLKDPVYTNLALGVAFAYYSDFTFVTLFPLFMFSLDYTMSETALCIAIGAACDLGGRVVFSLLGALCNIRSRTIFLIGSICMVLGRTVMIYVNNYWALTVANGFHGFFRAWIHVNFSLVFAEHCTQDRFPSAYGLFMAISGVIGMSTGPLIGIIRDVTNSYPICIHSLNLQMLLCVVPWIFELVYTRFISPSRKETTAS